jgi:hypothetical protein
MVFISRPRFARFPIESVWSSLAQAEIERNRERETKVKSSWEAGSLELPGGALTF